MASPFAVLNRVKERILLGLRCGLTMQRACMLAGTNIRLIRSWKTKIGTKFGQAYADFFAACEQASTEAEQELLATIRKAALQGFDTVETKIVEGTNKDGNYDEQVTTTKQVIPQWQAAGWLLERRFPKQYNKAGNKPASISDGNLSPEEFAAKAAEARNKMKSTIPTTPPADTK